MNIETVGLNKENSLKTFWFHEVEMSLTTVICQSGFCLDKKDNSQLLKTR